MNAKVFALPASSRRRARSVAPHPRLNSLRSLRSFAAIVVSLLFARTAAQAQVNSGSNGSDGAFNPATNTVINMAGRPNGIYQYTSVHISNGVTVTFIPNANNSPVVWLVQSNCTIDYNGTVSVSGEYASDVGGLGGPGGFRGGKEAMQSNLNYLGFRLLSVNGRYTGRLTSEVCDPRYCVR